MQSICQHGDDQVLLSITIEVGTSEAGMPKATIWIQLSELDTIPTPGAVRLIGEAVGERLQKSAIENSALFFKRPERSGHWTKDDKN